MTLFTAGDKRALSAFAYWMKLLDITKKKTIGSIQ